MSPQGVMSSEKATNGPGLSPDKGQKLSLVTQKGVQKLVLQPVFGYRQDLAN